MAGGKIYVCTAGKKCPKKGSREVAEALNRAVKELDGTGSLAIKECKCLDLCKQGPVVVVMPHKHKYGGVGHADARAIVVAQLSGAEPIKRLLIKKKN